MNSQEVISVATCKGSQLTFPKDTVVLADSGYQGIEAYHTNSYIPYKAKKNQPLSEQKKEDNRLLSAVRCKVEHVITRIKRFRILKERYRNRLNRFTQRFTLIAGLYNRMVTLGSWARTPQPPSPFPSTSIVSPLPFLFPVCFCLGFVSFAIFLSLTHYKSCVIHLRATSEGTLIEFF